VKICFLADGHHTNTTSWLSQLARGLDHEISLLTFGEPTVTIPGVRVYSIGPRARTTFRYVLWVPAVRRLINQINPDLLVAYRVTSYGFMGALTGYRPLVLAAQGQHIAYGGSKVRAVFARFAIKRASLIHSWGEHMTEALCGLGASPDKILTLPRGIDTSRFSNMAPREYRKGGTATLISTRGLNPDYNFEQIFDALSLLKSQGTDFKYVVCGDGPYRPQLERQIAALNLQPHVDLIGRAPHDEVARRLHDADLYISAVISDGVSASLLEAMASGVFPIVTDNKANRLWIEDGVNGFLAPYGDPAAMATLIQRAMDCPELRQRAEVMNRKIVLERASVQSNMHRFDTAWKALVQ
jgi:glycosyltransferase involved in cell wall biosynthesis